MLGDGVIIQGRSWGYESPLWILHVSEDSNCQTSWAALVLMISPYQRDKIAGDRGCLPNLALSAIPLNISIMLVFVDSFVGQLIDFELCSMVTTLRFCVSYRQCYMLLASCMLRVTVLLFYSEVTDEGGHVFIHSQSASRKSTCRFTAAAAAYVRSLERGKDEDINYIVAGELE